MCIDLYSDPGGVSCADNGDRLPPEHLQQFCMFAIDDHGEIQLKNLIDSAFEISNEDRKSVV